MKKRGHPVRQLSCVALLVAVLAAVSVIAYPSESAEPIAAATSSVHSYVPDLIDLEAGESEPGGPTGSDREESFLAETVETGLTLAPHHLPLIPLSAAAPKTAVSYSDQGREYFHSSAVGTARAPTGPPS